MFLNVNNDKKCPDRLLLVTTGLLSHLTVYQ